MLSFGNMPKYSLTRRMWQIRRRALPIDNIHGTV